MKRYFPAEFMAGVLTNGNGFYHPLVYVLECHRLGIRLLPPEANQPGPAFSVEGGSIRVPTTRVKGLTERTQARWYEARQARLFDSLTDFLTRVAPSLEESDALLRCGVFDCFGSTRTEQFWQLGHWLRCQGPQSAGQG